MCFLHLAPVRRLTLKLASMKQALRKVNLFKKESSTTRIANAEQMVVTATRLYIILASASISVLVLFNSLNPVAVSVTILSPTLATFEQLQATYPSTFTCKCKEVSVTYEVFFSITPTYHQVSRTAKHMHKSEILSARSG